MPAPLVAGVAGGVGTTTLACALGGPGGQAIDCGVYRGGEPVDVLVARSTMQSLGCAQRALAATPDPPILAVVADMPGAGLTRNMKARLEMAHVKREVLVLVPYVADWRDMGDPYETAVSVLVPDHQREAPLPKFLRGFADALRHLELTITPRMESQAALEQPAYGFTSPHPYPTAFPPNSVPAQWPGVQ